MLGNEVRMRCEEGMWAADPRGKPAESAALWPLVSQCFVQTRDRKNSLMQKGKGNLFLTDSLLQQNGNAGPLSKLGPLGVHWEESKERRSKFVGVWR